MEEQEEEREREKKREKRDGRREGGRGNGYHLNPRFQYLMCRLVRRMPTVESNGQLVANGRVQQLQFPLWRGKNTFAVQCFGRGSSCSGCVYLPLLASFLVSSTLPLDHTCSYSLAGLHHLCLDRARTCTCTHDHQALYSINESADSNIHIQAQFYNSMS